MEMLPVLEEDEGSLGSEERLRPRAVLSRERFYLLVVIGEIGSELQLDAARLHIERGERSVRPRCDAGCCSGSSTAAQQGCEFSNSQPGEDRTF